MTDGVEKTSEVREHRLCTSPKSLKDNVGLPVPALRRLRVKPGALLVSKAKVSPACDRRLVVHAAQGND